jgi:hypothetical protein
MQEHSVVKLAAHRHKHEDWPHLPAVANPDPPDDHEHRLDLEHLDGLAEAIFGEADRFAARCPERAEPYFARLADSALDFESQDYSFEACEALVELDLALAEFAELLP